MDKETYDENIDSTNSHNTDSSEAQCRLIDCDDRNEDLLRNYEPDTSSKRIDKSKADSSSTVLKASSTCSSPSTSTSSSLTSSSSLSSSSTSSSTSSTSSSSAVTLKNYTCSSITPPPSPDGKRQKLMENEIKNSNTNDEQVATTTTSVTTYNADSENTNHKSNNENNHCLVNTNIPGISASPPKFVTIEEIFKAANGVSNMYLAHEIALNENFRIEKRKASGLRKDVEIVMKQAFWDILQSQLNETPPVFKQALILLEEIKEILLSFLPTKETSIKKEIEEIIDLDLIKQQAENGALDFQRYAQYILSVMARLCAPCRDERIRELTQTSELIPLFSGIMDLLEAMKLDMANFAIEQVRPAILQQSVEYEKQKFKEYLTHSKMSNNEENLEMTKKWLRNVIENLDLSDEINEKIKTNKILCQAFTKLLTWNGNVDGQLPETILMDESRVKAISVNVEQIIRVGSVLLFTYSNIGTKLQDLNELKEKLKANLAIILEHDEADEVNTNNLKMKFEMAAEQIISTVTKYVNEKCIDYNIDELKQTQLRKQIIELNNKENRIRQIVERRLLEFIELVLFSNSMASVKIPSGLSAFQNDLTLIAGQYMKIYTHNRAVFGEYYEKIIFDLLNEVK